jgi:hypothetical protein
VKLSSSGLEVADFGKNCDCGVVVEEQHFFKKCGIAIVEVLFSSCGIAIADPKKSCACPPLIFSHMTFCFFHFVKRQKLQIRLTFSYDFYFTKKTAEIRNKPYIQYIYMYSYHVVCSLFSFFSLVKRWAGGGLRNNLSAIYLIIMPVFFIFSESWQCFFYYYCFLRITADSATYILV